ncbi:MAG: PEP-CTERM sorting domain-containing protein [Armatimonadota bacterium]
MCWSRGGVGADVVTVDGSDADWLGFTPDFTADDPDEAGVTLQGYDLDYTYYEWDQVNARMAFMMQTIDPTSQAYAADFVEFQLDADRNTGTGVNWHGAPGADYMIEWDFDGTANTVYTPLSATHKALLKQWNSGTSAWDTVAGLTSNDLRVAWGNHSTDYSIVEVTLNPTFLGFPANFAWGVYLDNGDVSADDNSPDNMRQDGRTPEPGTLALLPLGLAGLAVWRRSRRGA